MRAFPEILIVGLSAVHARCNSPRMQLFTRGQPVIVTTASHICGHKLVTIGEMREFNKNYRAGRVSPMVRSPSFPVPMR